MSFVNVSVGDQIAAPGGNILPGTTMQLGNWAISTNEVYVLILQPDGNLVLYQVIGAPPVPNGSFLGYAMWSTGTNVTDGPGASFAIQTDGNLVVYDANGNWVWQSGTENEAPPAELRVQTDGNLVLYDTSGGVLWSPNTYVNLVPLLPTLQQGCTGRFDGQTTEWHDLNNDGDNGATPTVVTLNSTTLELQGGYAYDHFATDGSGSGTMSLGIYLTGPATCVVTGSASGSWLNFSFSSSGTWQVLSGGDDPTLQFNLTDGPQITLSSFGDSVGWYQGIELQIQGQPNTCFENMSGASLQVERGRSPRPGPRAAAAAARRAWHRNEILQQMRGRVREIRERVLKLEDRGAAPSDVRVWSLAPHHDLGRRDGTERAPAAGSRDFRRCYRELHRGALPGVALPAPAEIEARAARHRAEGCVPIALAHVRYGAPTAAFSGALRRYARRGGPLPMPDAARPERSFEERTAFLAAPLCQEEYKILQLLPHVHPGLRVRYVVPSELVLTSPGASVSAVEIDFGDGDGYRAVKLDEPVEVSYAAAGDQPIRVRARAGDADLAAASHLAVTDQTPPTPSEIWSLGSPTSYQGVTATGYAFVFYGSGNTALTNPLVMAEGFPGGYSLATLWSMFNEQGLAQSLLGMGYDLILVGFDDGTTYVEANAGVVIAAVQRAISETTASTQLVVGGASMGGLVSRYALAYMESNSMPHQTAYYVSYDTPHLGANVPMGVQSFIGLVNDLDPQSSLDPIIDLLNSSAAQEMLISWLDPTNQDAEAMISPLRQSLIQNLTAVGGFPAQPRLLGVSNGAVDGTLNGTPSATTVISDNDTIFVLSMASAPGITDSTNYTQPVDNEACYVAICDAGEGYFSWGGDVPEYDSAPGGTETFFETVGTTLQQDGWSPVVNYQVGCFVPTISALSMSSLSVYDNDDLTGSVEGGPSDLDAWTGSANDPHVTITPDTAEWLLQQIPAPAAALASPAEPPRPARAKASRRATAPRADRPRGRAP